MATVCEPGAPGSVWCGGGVNGLRSGNPMKLRAHRILDEVRAGIHHDQRAVRWALAVLGEPVGV